GTAPTATAACAPGSPRPTTPGAKITVSYGDDPTQYPALMAGGAFVHTAALTTATGTGTDANAFPPAPYVHAYNADGQEIYNQKTQPNPRGARP
ncbi:hypothetical protein ABZW03_35440, partial [Kitasatospora sp. NPDC004799]